MKKIVFLLTIVCCLLTAKAQKYDNYWIFGADPDFQSQPWFGNGYVEFVNDTIIANDRNRNIAMWHCQQTVSDAEGNLQFYSNGMWIQDTSGQKIENGDSLNFGWLWQYFYSSATSGSTAYSVPEGVFALPKPNNDSVFILIHTLWENGNFPSAGRVCYTEVVKENNSWKAKGKNTYLTPFYYSAYRSIAACKHANGRDWWILSTEENTNCIMKFLVTIDTLIFIGRQCLGDSVNYGEGMKSCFSLDGSKFVNCGVAHGFNVSDFDRCTGNLSNTINIKGTLILKPDTNIAIALEQAWSLEFSPNNRFLYVLLPSRIYQYNLESMDILGTRDSIMSDHFLDTITGNHYTFFTIQTGPDGVMYLGPSSSGRYLNTINNPNGKGDSCDFRVRNIPLTKNWYVGMPYYPNYRLGRLLGSSCDTLYSDIKPIYTQTPWLKIYPNPATNEVQFDYNWVEWEKIEDCKLKIEDIQGRVVYEQPVPKYSTRQNFSVKQLAAGVYTVTLTSSNSSEGGGQNQLLKLATCKLVKE